MRGLLPSRGESWFGLLLAALLFSVFSLQKGKKSQRACYGGRETPGMGAVLMPPVNPLRFTSSWEQKGI